MSCLYGKAIFRKFLCCCDTSAENVCCIIGTICLIVSFNHLCNFIPFFCLATAIPHCLIMLLFALAGSFLIAGVAFDKPILLVLFPWIMIVCIVVEVIYGILLFAAQKCLSSILNLLFSGWVTASAMTGAVLGYIMIGIMAGIDFVFSLYALLLISCTVTEIVIDDDSSSCCDEDDDCRH